MEVSLLLSVKDDGERMRGRTVQEVCLNIKVEAM